MNCVRCENAIEVSGVFPGAKVMCACGAENVVMREGVTAPFRTPGTRHDKHVEVSRGITIKRACPRCAKPLHEGETHEQTAEICSGCGGIFVKHDALRTMIDAAHDTSTEGENTIAKRRAALERDVRYLECPRCDQRMERMNFGQRSGIVVDVCKMHGTWFDASELDGVLEFVRRGGLHAEDVLAPKMTPEMQEAQRATNTMKSVLHDEQMHEEMNVRAVTSLLEDVLWVLAPGVHRWGRRRSGW
jgi:Zn-finger nucleic acid-binding protein